MRAEGGREGWGVLANEQEHTLILRSKQEIVDELESGRDKRSKSNTVLVLYIDELEWSHDNHMTTVRQTLYTMAYDLHLQ